jgi:hypothetical protein
MKVTITRLHTTPTGTPGGLISEKGFRCDTLELPWQHNRSGVSCINADTYKGRIWFSPHLNRNVVRLEDKHGRKDCLIHNGNFAGDVTQGYETQVHGCTEVGHGYAEIARPDGKLQHGISNSVSALATLIDRLGAGEHEFVYVWADGCAPLDLADHNGAERESA